MAVLQALETSSSIPPAHALGTIGGDPLSQEPPTPSDPASLPATGAPATPGAYPFNARIEDKANGMPRCSGTQIKPGWVLTAAHCVDGGVQPGDLQLRTGATDVKAPGQSGMLRQVVDIRIHPRYHGSGEADIALLRLEAGQASCQVGGAETPCTPARYAGESVYVGAPPGSPFYRGRVQGEAESGDACASGKLADGLALGWGKQDTQELKTAELEIRNHCAGPQDSAPAEPMIDAVGPGERCPADSGGALIAFTDTGLPFLVGVAGTGAETCIPHAETVEFSEVAEGELRDWIEHVTGKQRDRRYGANRRLPATSKRPAETPDSPIARMRPVDDGGGVESPPIIEQPPSDAPPPAAPPPPPPPPPPSTQQNGALAAAAFTPGYSTNLQLSVAAGYTTPGRPLRIAVAWDGLHFEGEQVYNGTAPYIASHAYDPHGQFSLNVTPVVRVTDPAIIGPGAAPLSVTKPAALTLHPVYDISFSPLRSAERQTFGFFGDCDVGSEGEGTLHWSSIFKRDEIGHKYVSFPDTGINTVGEPWWGYAKPVQAFAVTYHVDTAGSDLVHFPVVFFTEDELLPAGPPFGFTTRSGGDALFPFVGDNGTNIATFAVVTRPTDTSDEHCRIRMEYEVRVQLDLTPGDADSPPPLGSPPPPPPTGGGGGSVPVPGGGSPIQEK